MGRYITLLNCGKNLRNWVSHSSPAETLRYFLAAYKEWGVDCVQHLNGMWAFVLYDSEAKRVICSRDRFWEQPLLYYMDDDSLVIGSEAR